MNHICLHQVDGQVQCVTCQGNIWHKDAQDGKKGNWQRQCDAMGNVLLGNLGYCQQCGCHFDIYQLTKLVAGCVKAFIEIVLPDGCGLFQQGDVPYHKATMI